MQYSVPYYQIGQKFKIKRLPHDQKLGAEPTASGKIDNINSYFAYKSDDRIYLVEGDTIEVTAHTGDYLLVYNKENCASFLTYPVIVQQYCYEYTMQYNQIWNNLNEV